MAPAVTAKTSLIDLRDLLDLLRRHPLPTPFNLAIFSEQQGTEKLREAIRSTCRPINDELLCDRCCCERWEDTVNQALVTNGPEVHRCPHGFLNFAIPFPVSEGIPDCLLGGGIREHEPSQEFLKKLADQPDEIRAMILDEWQKLPAASTHETQGIAEEIFRILPRLLDQHLHNLSLARITERLSTAQEITRDLDRCRTSEEILDMISEALVVMFDLPKVLILLKQPGSGLTLHTTLGLDPEKTKLDESRLIDAFDIDETTPRLLCGPELTHLLPGVEAHTAQLVPMTDGGRQLGVIALLDIDLHLRDQALIELLVGRLSARLNRLQLEARHDHERTFSTRMVSMISDLALINNEQELLQNILDMSAELLCANNGSMMLLDETGSQLSIAAAKGMSRPLVKTMSVAFGEGIAGRVVKNGFPMLVNDIERDNRIATPNRPRFKTKSFISLPLKTKERTIGVLNLADKADGNSFTETDLNLVQSFTNHAVLMIDRAASLERAGHLEELAITDPLTGLYNRRFLETRLEEELNRSQRQQQSFCIILADLDNFKLYNDICGHVAGDKALRKASLLMRRSAREMDIVTRYGGEEFCLVLPGTTKKESVFVAERIRRTIEADSFPGETNLPLGRLTISLGIACYPEDDMTTADLIHAADLALYKAKEQGRNRVVLFDASLANLPIKLNAPPE
jgi:diguanylate cyclase (GGDEF)-like protein